MRNVVLHAFKECNIPINLMKLEVEGMITRTPEILGYIINLAAFTVTFAPHKLQRA